MVTDLQDSSLLKDQLTVRGGLSSVHRASGLETTDADSWTDSQHMLLSLFLLSSDNRVEGTGVLRGEGTPNSL